MNRAYWLNSAWMMSARAEARAFRRATYHVRYSQERILSRLLRKNRHTWYGQRYGFSRITSVHEYQRRVPVVDYDCLRQPLARIAGGEANVLTAKRVVLLEPTGGSTSGEKLIPYTRSLHREFQRALATWVFDIMWSCPGVRCGRAYWSISPMNQTPRKSSGGIPIGFDDDRDYLTLGQRWTVSQLLAAPPNIRQLRCMDNARYATLLYLLACRDLAVISVWSPTFLTALLSDLPRWLESICDDLEAGQIRLPTSGDNVGSLPMFPAPDRASELQRIFDEPCTFAESLGRCWPHLSLISCWADSSSAMYAMTLRELFPRVFLQPKGLLATEGVVSVPLVSARAHALAVRSHFFEFVDVQSDCEPRLADQLERHGRYRVLLTTGGGLYRYDLRDEVEVLGFVNRCPLLRFLGRSDGISDLVGEKLNEQHVRHAIESACDETQVVARFALLAPAGNEPRRYRLYLECSNSASITTSSWLDQLAAKLETYLRENPQYALAVGSGQLAPSDVCLLKSGSWQVYQRIRMEHGQLAGDIKPTLLDHWSGWEAAFADGEAHTQITTKPKTQNRAV